MRSCAGVVTHGLRLRGRLDILPNFLKRHWRQFMVEKWTFNSLATAVVDIPLNLRHLWPFIVPNTRCTCAMITLKTSVALCFVTKRHILEWPCPQHKVNPCNDHDVISASWYATPVVRWMDYLGKGERLTNVCKKCWLCPVFWLPLLEKEIYDFERGVSKGPYGV